MSVNKLEKFEMVVRKRSSIQLAEYNPRTIGREQKKRLDHFMTTYGLFQGLVVNKQTNNLVSGHQRIAIMDKEFKYPKVDYDMTVHEIDVDSVTEKKINVFLNNTSAMGEFDNDMLKDLFLGLGGGSIDDLGTIEELGFDRLDVEAIFAGDGDFLQSVYNPQNAIQDVVSDEIAAQRISKLKELKQTERDLRKSGEHTEGGDYQSKHDDYMITFVCQSNSEKQDIMRRLGEKADEKFVRVGKLFDIQDGKIRVYGLE